MRLNNKFNEIPEELFKKIIIYLKFDDIISLKISNKINNKFISKNQEQLLKKLLENKKYNLYENRSSFNIHKNNNTFSITKSRNIKTLADVIIMSNLEELF